MNSILDRISKKLTAMGIGVGTGIAAIEQGISDTTMPTSIRVTTIIGGFATVIFVGAIYIMTQGNIDKLKEEATKTGKEVIDTVLKEK